MKPRAMAIAAFGGALTVGTAASAALVLAAMFSGGSAGIAPVRLSQSVGYDFKANALVAGPPTPAALDAAEDLSRKALAQYPYDSLAWLRLAYIDSVRPGGLSARGIAALETSYTLTAVEPLSTARLQFCLNNWGRVSPTVRKAAIAEFEILARSGQHRAPLERAFAGVRDPAGRMVAGFWLADLRLMYDAPRGIGVEQPPAAQPLKK